MLGNIKTLFSKINAYKMLLVRNFILQNILVILESRYINQNNKNNYFAYDKWENLYIHRTDSYYVRNKAI